MVMRTTFTRNSAGWSLNDESCWAKSPADTLRRGYDGALIEGQAVPLVRDTEDLSASSWSSVSSSNTTVSPPLVDGMTPLSFTAPSGDRRYPRQQNIQVIDTDQIAILRARFRPGAGCETIALGCTNGPVKWSWIGFNTTLGTTDQYNISDAGTAEFVDAVELLPGLWDLTVRITGGSSTITGVMASFGAGDASDLRYNSPIAACEIGFIQCERGEFSSSYVRSESSIYTRAPDFFNAPGGQNEYGPGLHTWRNAVRMSRDPGEPTILSSAEHRIYAKNGRLHLDGPGELIQPDGEHAPGDYVPFIWNVQFPGAAPDFTLGREYGDTNWWNGHLVDIVPFPRNLTAAEINAWVGA